MTTSRNQREGRYAGKLYGQHWRSRFYHGPGHYNAVMTPYVEAVMRSKRKWR
jgi:hypothetical protein